MIDKRRVLALSPQLRVGQNLDIIQSQTTRTFHSNIGDNCNFPAAVYSPTEYGGLAF